LGKIRYKKINTIFKQINPVLILKVESSPYSVTTLITMDKRFFHNEGDNEPVILEKALTT